MTEHILTLADKIVAGLRVAEARDTYHLERAELATVGQAMRWLAEWRTPNGDLIWRSSEFGDAGREALSKQWLFLRFAFRREYAERGGRDA